MINTLLIAALTINVLIVDTGLFPTNEMVPYISDYEPDFHGHGTMMTSLILFGDLKSKDPVCKEVRVTVCNYLDYKNDSSMECLDKLTKNTYDIVNISGGGYSKQPKEDSIIKGAKGNPIIVAAIGNDNKDITKHNFYPAYLSFEGVRNVLAIGNGTSLYNKSINSNWATHSIIWIDGNNKLAYDNFSQIVPASGTSISAALYTHKLLKEKCSLIHSK